MNIVLNVKTRDLNVKLHPNTEFAAVYIDHITVKEFAESVIKLEDDDKSRLVAFIFDSIDLKALDLAHFTILKGVRDELTKKISACTIDKRRW